MRIGFDGSRAFLGERTGTENYSYQLLRAFSKIDKKNNYIIYLRPDTKGVTLQGWPKNFQFKMINWPRFWTQGGLALECLLNSPDVLFVPAHTLPLIRRPGLKIVVTVHDLGAEYLPAMHQLKQVLYLKLMTHLQLKSATKIIAVSKATKLDLVKKVGIDPKKIAVIYEGYDSENFKFQISNFKFKNDVLVNSLSKYFLFVGTVQPRKNLERVIKAFRKFYKNFNNYSLIIAGGRGWMSDSIYQLPTKLGIGTKVKFLGYVPDEKLPALYSGATALVFPSLFEGFGLPILEAQACGCPVITSDVSSMLEVAGSGAVYVNPYSVDDIVKGMIEVQSSKFPPEARLARGGKVQSLIKAGFENVKRFSWEKCAGETLKVLEGL